MEYCDPSLILIFIGLVTSGTVDSKEMDIKFENLTVNVGENVTLSCPFEGVPVGYTWEFKIMGTNGQKKAIYLASCFRGKSCVIYKRVPMRFTMDGSNLVLFNVDKESEGLYICDVSTGNAFKLLTFSRIITVRTPPKSIFITFNKSQNSFQEDEYVNIRCTVYGSNPEAKISMFIVANNRATLLKVTSYMSENSPIAENSVNTLWRPNYTQHRGFVMCTAANEAGSLTKNSSLLNIQYGPKIRQSFPGVISARINETIDLTCDVSANPPASVEWIINNKSRRIASSELKTKVHSEMAGRLTCNASNNIGSQTKTIDLIVMRDPTIFLKPVHKFREKVDATINCTVDSVPPPDFVRWYKLPENDRDPPALVSNNAILNFIKIDRSLSGSYQCVAQNTQVPTSGKTKVAKSKSITNLTVTYAPGDPQIISDQQIIVQLGESFQLFCAANKRAPGEPFPTFRWIDSETKLTISNSAKFYVQDAQTEHNGNYICVAKNEIDYTFSSQIASVLVNEPPTLIAHSKEHKLALAYSHLPSSVDFFCEFRGRPMVSVRWTYENQQINSTADYKIKIIRNSSRDKGSTVSSILTINLHSTNFPHKPFPFSPPNGKYSCQSKNIYGTAKFDNFLIIKYPPYIRVSRHERKVAAVTGQTTNIHLRCQVESISRVNVMWFRSSDHFRLPESDEKYSITVKELSPYDENKDLFALAVKVSELTIRDINLADFTNYTCIAFNDEGKERLNFQVVSKSKPDPPYELKLIHVGWETVKCSWRSGFNGGLNQIFEIHIYSDQTGVQTSHYDSDKIENFLDLQNLYPNVNYSLMVQAVNNVGKSDNNPVMYFTTERIKTFDYISATILSDKPKIAILLNALNLCVNLEYTRDGGRHWFKVLHCARLNGSKINETVFLDIGRITSMQDLLAGIIHFRLTFCLISRESVCSNPFYLENPKNSNLMTQTIILVIAIICFVLVLVLIILFIVCCARFNYMCKTRSSRNSLCCCCCCCFTNRSRSKRLPPNYQYSNAKMDGKPASGSGASYLDNLDETDMTPCSPENHSSSLMGCVTPHIMRNKIYHNPPDVPSGFICTHHDFSSVPILYEGSSFLHPSIVALPRNFNQSSCEASSSHSHSSGGSSGHMSQNRFKFRSNTDSNSNSSIIKQKLFSQSDGKPKLPDVTSDAVYFSKSVNDKNLIEAVV